MRFLWFCQKFNLFMCSFLFENEHIKDVLFLWKNHVLEKSSTSAMIQKPLDQ